MRKHLFVTLLLACGMPLTGNFAAYAAPEPQSQGQSVVTVTGTVLDENNEPVIGASVVQKGVKANATATNFDGNFTIRVPHGAKLQVSFVGYKSVEMTASQGMKVYLQPTTEMLNELVAVGYGTQKRANLTGAVATVDVARTMDSRPVTDVAKALQGAVPGLTISMANGDINSNPSINIRGVGTLSKGHTSSPLIVVDGVPVDDLSFINPEDIQDISVLKDAASSSIYGTRAAFGVILVTTKSANKADRVSVTYNNNFGWSDATVLPTPNSTVDQLLVAMDNTMPGGDTEIFGMYYTDILPFARLWAQQHDGPYTSVVPLQHFESASNVGDYYMFPANSDFPAGVGEGKMLSARYLSYADWDVSKTVFHSAFSQKHNIGLEGVSGKTNYRMSFGYDGKEGLLRYNPDQLKRYNANVNITTEIFSWLKGGTRINFSQRNYQTPNINRNAYQYLWRWPAFWENYGTVLNADGQPQGFRNDISIRQLSGMDYTVRNSMRTQAFLDATLFKGFVLHGDYTYDLRNMNNEYANTPYTTWDNWSPGANSLGSYNPVTQASSYAAQNNSRDYLWTANIYGTYDFDVNKDNHFRVMMGWNAEKQEYTFFSVRRTGLCDYSLPNINLTDGTTYTTSADKWRRASTGFFGRLNYNYKDIYLFEANGRYDGSTNFPAHDQWAFFPSFSAGYRFSEEAYFAPLKSIVSNGKVRASYGHIGNETVQQYAFLPIVSAVSPGSAYWLNGDQKMTMFNMPSLVSSSLTWERIATADLGVDLGFFNNSLNLGFDVYQRDTKDMLGPSAALPSVLGASSPTVNSGELRTRGWELSLGWNHSFGDADVYATFNIADARTKITKWNAGSSIIYSYLPTGSSYTEGRYFGDIWGFETDRYFTEADFVGTDAKGNPIYADGVASQQGLQSADFKYGPGDVKFKDLNGDGVINNGDPTMIELDGKYYVSTDAGYAEAKANPNAKKVSVGTLENHGDLKVIGNAMPRFEYSFRMGGAWKGFDADIFFQGVGKRDMWATGSTIIPMAQSGLGTFTNQLSYNKQVDGKWYIDEANTYPRMYSGAGGAGTVQNIGNGRYNFYPQTRYLMNLAYLRIKNLTVGYTLPASLTKQAQIQRARVYFSADNLCFLYNGVSKYQLDPEMTTAAGSSVQGYNDGNATYGRTVPMQQTLSFGIQVTL